MTMETAAGIKVSGRPAESATTGRDTSPPGVSPLSYDSSMGVRMEGPQTVASTPPDNYGQGTGLGRFPTFGAAYIAAVSALLEYGRHVDAVRDVQSISSRFGTQKRDFLELQAVTFVIDDPQSCMILSKARPFHLAYSYAQVLWVLAGSDDIRWISFYNRAGLPLSPDGKTLPTAMGARLRSAKAGDQLMTAIQTIGRDPASRRAICYFALPEDSIQGVRDLPCATSIQFVIREGLLDAIVTMRSQSVFSVLPYDVFLFTRIQEYVSRSLGVPMGRYIHFATSHHLYLDEMQEANRFRLAAWQPASPAPMADVDVLPEYIEAEFRFRSRLISGDATAIGGLLASLPARADFFTEALAIFSWAAANDLHLKADEATAREWVRPVIRSLMEQSLRRDRAR